MTALSLKTSKSLYIEKQTGTVQDIERFQFLYTGQPLIYVNLTL